jgi:hypothetical protein
MILYRTHSTGESGLRSLIRNREITGAYQGMEFPVEGVEQGIYSTYVEGNTRRPNRRYVAAAGQV